MKSADRTRALRQELTERFQKLASEMLGQDGRLLESRSMAREGTYQRDLIDECLKSNDRVRSMLKGMAAILGLI